jgi:hypothetical protein
MINRLSGLFNQLICTPHGHTYSGIEIPGHAGIYLAVDLNLLPCLFIMAESRIIEAPLKTAYVSLLPNQSYRLTLCDDLEIERLFHTIICSSSKQADINTFLSLLEGFIEQNADYQTASLNIAPFFRNIVRLFSVQPVRDKASERQGLWGELFVMRSMNGYSYWAPFWHNELTDVFDFSTSNKRLEVKTSASGQRIHHITHRQVYAMHGEEIVLASLVVIDDQDGLSLRGLIDECKAELLGSIHYFKIEKAARHVDIHNIEDPGPSYNIRYAEDSLAFFRSEDIPHFTMPEPPGVSQTSFRADLSNATRIDIEWLSQWLDGWSTYTLGNSKI